MLPSDLLVARRYRDTIRPTYAEITEVNLELSRRLIRLFETHIGRRKKTLEEAVGELEGESGRDYRYVRGLAILLERRCRFEVEAAIPPDKARDMLFHTAARAGVPTTPEERSRIMEEEATALGVSSHELEESLYADLEEEQVLKEFQPVEAQDILRLYNLGLTQTLLFRCTEMEFTASGNWQLIFRWIKLLGLIYTIRRQDEGYRVRVDGPLSLFKLGTRYGTTLAKLVPHIVAAPEWSVKAWILRRRGDHQLLRLELDSFRHDGFLKALLPVKEEYDSMVEESFAQRFNALKTGWKLTREPAALPVGRHVMIPDFLFEKAGMRVYMEVAGFWTPQYLKHKLDQLRGVEGVDMIVAADNQHACQQLDSLRRKLDIVYYKGRVPLQPILSHLKAKEAELRSQQAERLKREEIKIQGSIVYTAELSQRLEVLEDAVKEELKHRDFPGYRFLGDVLIKESTLQKIEKRLDNRMRRGALTLKGATELIEELGGGRPSRILEHLGYTIEWRGINPEMAQIHKRT
jgi:predicted nuclease of restriction endonuclease-like RecB superfamily